MTYSNRKRNEWKQHTFAPTPSNTSTTTNIRNRMATVQRSSINYEERKKEREKYTHIIRIGNIGHRNFDFHFQNFVPNNLLRVTGTANFCAFAVHAQDEQNVCVKFSCVLNIKISIKTLTNSFLLCRAAIVAIVIILLRFHCNTSLASNNAWTVFLVFFFEQKCEAFMFTCKYAHQPLDFSSRV